MSLLFEGTCKCTLDLTLVSLEETREKLLVLQSLSYCPLHSRCYRKSVSEFVSNHSIIHSRHSYMSTYFVQGAVLLKDREVKW